MEEAGTGPVPRQIANRQDVNAVHQRHDGEMRANGSIFVDAQVAGRLNGRLGGRGIQPLQRRNLNQNLNREYRGDTLRGRSAGSVQLATCVTETNGTAYELLPCRMVTEKPPSVAGSGTVVA
jgi:hypothetical protein